MTKSQQIQRRKQRRDKRETQEALILQVIPHVRAAKHIVPR